MTIILFYDMEFNDALNVEIIHVFSHACNDTCFAGWITRDACHRKIGTEDLKVESFFFFWFLAIRFVGK